jgi:RNA polymerase sigma-70 factor (ECF subfamily)
MAFALPKADARSDEQLMLAYAAGDAAAFDVLYARHEQGLFRFVRRLLGSDMASAHGDEVFQDTWLRVVNARASFTPASASFKTWAYTIAHNAAMDRLRVKGRHVSLDRLGGDGDSEDGDAGASPLDWLCPAVDMAHPSSEDLAFWRAAGQQLLRCLDQLPDAQRAAFLLHHEDGASVEELAQRLNLGFETVKSRLRYGLNKLRGCMGHYLAVLEGRTEQGSAAS